MCETGKRGFGLRAEAVKTIRVMERRRRIKSAGRGGGKLEPYRCPFCKEYHIGHTKGERKKVQP